MLDLHKDWLDRYGRLAACIMLIAFVPQVGWWRAMMICLDSIWGFYLYHELRALLRTVKARQEKVIGYRRCESNPYPSVDFAVTCPHLTGNRGFLENAYLTHDFTNSIDRDDTELF